MRNTKQTKGKKELTITIQLELDILKERGYYTDNPNSLGQYLRKVRIEKEMTAKQMAKAIGCTQDILLAWETDNRIPSIKTIRQILKQINIPQEIIGETLSGKYSIDKALLFNSDEIKKKLHDCTTGKGKVLRALRLSLLKTHREMAKDLGIDPSTLLDWENERHRISKGMVERIKNF